VRGGVPCKVGARHLERGKKGIQGLLGRPHSFDLYHTYGAAMQGRPDDRHRCKCDDKWQRLRAGMRSSLCQGGEKSSDGELRDGEHLDEF